MKLDELLNSNPSVKQLHGEGVYRYGFQSGDDKIDVVINKEPNFKNGYNIGFSRLQPGKKPTEDLTNSGDSVAVFSGVLAAVKKFMNSKKVDLFTVYCVPSRVSAYSAILNRCVKKVLGDWTILSYDDDQANIIMRRLGEEYKRHGREVFYIVKTSKVKSLKQDDDPEAIIHTRF